MPRMEVPPIPPPQLDYAARPSRAVLIAFGAMLLVLGVGAGCVGMFLPLTAMLPNVTQQPTSTLVMSAAMYLGVSAVFAWLGVATMMSRRWVRPVLLALGWPWLIVGAVSVLSMFLNLGPMTEAMQMRQQPGVPMPKFFIGIVLAVVVGFNILLMVGLPLVIVLYMRRPRTEEILKAYDSRSNWTDHCSQEILTWVLAMALCGIAVLPVLFHPIVPLGNRVITGLPAAGAILLIAGSFLAIAYGSYRRHMLAWWGSMVAMVVLCGVWLLMMIGGGMIEVWRAMGLPEDQIEVSTKMVSGPRGWVSSALIIVITFWYLAKLKRHFVRDAKLGRPSI
jgi:hypothetical protein